MFENDALLTSMRDTMQLERELQNLINENELLKSKLYTKTLDPK